MSVYFQKIKYQKHFYIAEYFGIKQLYVNLRFQSQKKKKTQHSKNKGIIASRRITSWQIEGEKVETVTDFIFLSSKITADGDCSHKIKRHLLLGREAKSTLEEKLCQT